jgi:hypothetical protein
MNAQDAKWSFLLNKSDQLEVMSNFIDKLKLRQDKYLKSLDGTMLVKTRQQKRDLLK